MPIFLLPMLPNFTSKHWVYLSNQSAGISSNQFSHISAKHYLTMGMFFLPIYMYAPIILFRDTEFQPLSDW